MPKWTLNQQKAIDVRGHNVIVSAGAGSGKTAVLTERVFQLLNEGTMLDEILVLTFTNAAASEMRERIRAKLLSNPKLFQVASQIDASDICTFDAFALSLVKKYHYFLGIGNHVSIIDENIIKIKKRKLIDSLFDESYNRGNEAFLTMISKYALRSDDDLKDFVLRIDDMANLKIDKAEYLETYLAKYFSETKIKTDLSRFKDFVIDLAKDIQKGTLAYENPKMGDLVYQALETIVQAPDYDSLNEALANFKYPTKNRLSEADSLLHDSLKAGCEKFASYAAIGKADEVIKRYLATKETVAVLLEIIQEMDRKLEVFKKTYEVYTFSDIAKMALFLVRSTEVGKTLKNKLRYIMIDEYQDTSDIQEEFVNAIGNNNVYMVGDIKQSIYRFRNANSDIFSDKYLNYKKNVGGEAIDLNENFRSREEVIEDINGLFSTIMSLSKGGADYSRSHVILHGNKAYETLGKTTEDHHFDILCYENNPEIEKSEHEACLIAEDILGKIKKHYPIFDKDASALRDADFKDFTILIDRKTKFDIFQKTFSRYGIPLRVERDADLSDSDVVLTFQNLVRLFNSILTQSFDNTFRHAFFSVARSFLFQMPDQTLFTLDKERQYKQTVLFAKVSKVIALKKSCPLNDILSSLIDEFSFFEHLTRVGNISENRHKIQSMIEVSKNLETIGYGLEEFVEYFEDLANYDIALAVPSNETVENCVRLMSIHKSKGLEFPVVYYCGLSSRFNDQNTKSSFLADATYGVILPLIDEFEASNVYHYLMKYHERRAELSEQIRLFYVALTRAKEKMIFLYPLPDKEKTPLFSLDSANSFYDFIRYTNVRIKRCKEAEVQGLTLFPTKQKTEDLSVIMKENNIVFEVVAKKRASKALKIKTDFEMLDFGTRMHAWLELVDFKTKDTHFISDTKEQALVSKVVRLPLFENLEECKIYKEYEFIDPELHSHGIIDLLLIYSERAIIVDYKLKTIDDAAYSEQLKTYKNFIARVFKRTVECYLLSVITGEVRRVELL